MKLEKINSIGYGDGLLSATIETSEGTLHQTWKLSVATEEFAEAVSDAVNHIGPDQAIELLNGVGRQTHGKILIEAVVGAEGFSDRLNKILFGEGATKTPQLTFKTTEEFKRLAMATVIDTKWNRANLKFPLNLKVLAGYQCPEDADFETRQDIWTESMKDSMEVFRAYVKYCVPRYNAIESELVRLAPLAKKYERGEFPDFRAEFDKSVEKIRRTPDPKKFTHRIAKKHEVAFNKVGFAAANREIDMWIPEAYLPRAAMSLLIAMECVAEQNALMPRGGLSLNHILDSYETFDEDNVWMELCSFNSGEPNYMPHINLIVDEIFNGFKKITK